jgi:Pectate lyase superfamily protein
MIRSALIGLFALVILSASRAENIVFPKDVSVYNVREHGARGDGTTDDTAALQKAIDESTTRKEGTQVLYIPNGTYLVSQTLVVKNALGPWLYGQSRDGVIIKLKDGVKDVSSVIRTHPNTKGPTSADWFMRNLRNFTIDVGNNPTTDGIQYYATNTGSLQNVRVTGRGKVGINSGFLDQNGPCLVQDCEVDGFETGVLSQWNWSQVLSRVTIKNCSKVGLQTEGTVTSVEDIVIENTPQPILTLIPNDWHWWGAVMAISGAKITGNNPEAAAIENKSILYARNVEVKGYKFAIASRHVPNKDVPGPTVSEYHSHAVQSAFELPKEWKTLNLPVKREPELEWESDVSKWLCANDYGAKPGDNQDDTAAFQKAFDTAAKEGKTVVYFRAMGPEPNWYNIEGEVKIPRGVRLFLGMGYGRILGGKNGKFVVDDNSAPVVRVQNVDSFGGPGVTIENRSTNNTLHVQSCGVNVLGTGTGDIFCTDTPIKMNLKNPKQKVWCRQLNPEGDSDEGIIQNDGADLWVLGMKCEGRGVRVATRKGGRTEVFGTFIYGPGVAKGDDRPIFAVEDASLCVLGLREMTFAGETYFQKVREKRGEQKKVFSNKEAHGWIGWSLYHGAQTDKK